MESGPEFLIANTEQLRRRMGKPGGHLTFTQYTYILDMGLGKHHVHAVGGSTTQRGLRGLRASMPKRMAPASRYDAGSPGGSPPICCDPRARRPQQCLQISCRSRAGGRMADSSGRGGLAIPPAAGRAAATARRWGRWCKNRPVNVDSHRNRADPYPKPALFYDPSGPRDPSRRLGGHIVDRVVDPPHLVDDPGRDATEELVGEGVVVGGHAVGLP